MPADSLPDLTVTKAKAGKLLDFDQEAPKAAGRNPAADAKREIVSNCWSYEELRRLGAELDLSAAALTRGALSEFVAKYRDGIEADLPLTLDRIGSGIGGKTEGSRGK